MLEKMTQAAHQVIFNISSDAIIVIDKFGTIIIFNSAAKRILGIKKTSLIGTQFRKGIPLPKLSEALGAALQGGTTEYNRQWQIGDSTVIANCVVLKDRLGNIIGAALIMQDITKTHRLEKMVADLRETRSLLEAILRATDDAITVVNEDGNGILINPAYTKLTGLTEADVLHKPASVAVTEGESMHLRVLKTGQLVRGVRLKIGPLKKEVLVNVAPVIVDGKLRGSVGVIHDITEIMQLSEELASARKLIRHLQAKYTFDDIIGQSEPLQAAIALARHASDTPATVLLRGESGTGKELFAHAMHHASGRGRGPFVRVNCVAIVETLLESELFGYEEGAFTGALRGGKKGYFEDANGGTIFLDEIGDMNPALQARLLRVLQEKEITRVGGTRPIPINVRIIAATNANLEQRLLDGSFREDLYYRLNVVPIFVPPLRVRKDDIPLLCTHLGKKLQHEYRKKVVNISTAVYRILADYDWPGNVRELENVLGRAMIQMDQNEETILPRHLPEYLSAYKKKLKAGTGNYPVDTVNEKPQGGSLADILNQTEKNALIEALQEANGNKTRAAQTLGIAIRSLYYKLEKHKLS